ncbi:hypothetical protein FSARC_10158 [Fusarium sarcochroum]|uniref:Putative gamma-glutamylcyclotransferase n=1 Tax=Fusarium sarcochroum TaxID=1208366 RepID=A0A8H4TP69_9HYPO|nr:hypothetical protein FSARC_10158 [Fusarium sarcochroum]
MASEQVKPVFIYGTLCALRLLSHVLAGDCCNVIDIEALTRPGKIHGYKQYSVDDGASSTVIKDEDPSSVVYGLLLTLKDSEQREKLDAYGGQDYRPSPVTVLLDNDEEVDADMYLWVHAEEELCPQPFDLVRFNAEYMSIFDVDEYSDDDMMRQRFLVFCSLLSETKLPDLELLDSPGFKCLSQKERHVFILARITCEVHF